MAADAPCPQSRPVACVDFDAAYGDGRCTVFELQQLLLFRHDVPDA
jgi:hypothetical protein